VNLGLSEEQRAVREVFADLFAKEASPERVRAAEPLGHDPQLWAKLIATGALGVAVPESLGGGGGGLLELALIAEEAGRRVAPVPLAEPAAAARLLAACGARDLLAAALDGSRLISIAPRSVALEAQLLPDGAVADAVVTLDEDRVVCVKRPQHVRTVPNVGSLPLARWFDATEIEVIASGAEAMNCFQRALDDVRVVRAASLVGLAHEAVDIGAEYARERLAFGVPIGTYQGVAHPLADAVVMADGAQMLVWKACWALDAGEQQGPALASMAVVFAGRVAYQAAQHSLHIHGGYGFMAEYDIQLYYRRAKAWLTVFTDPRRELQVLADRRFGPARVAVPAAREEVGG
jgi:alkylation response protein AidB-like acyl-CoA dehydrogenase